jgi:hypothetical protein
MGLGTGGNITGENKRRTCPISIFHPKFHTDSLWFELELPQ